MEQIISPRSASVSPNGYGVGSGTSDAAAIMSGVAALVRAKYPDLDAANVVNRLIRTARDQGPAGRDSQYGFGAVDPLAALTRSVPAVDAHPLLAGAADGAAPSAGAATPSKDDGPAVSISMKKDTGALVQGALCLLVPLALLILVIVLVRRSRRKTAAARTRPARVPAPRRAARLSTARRAARLPATRRRTRGAARQPAVRRARTSAARAERRACPHRPRRDPRPGTARRPPAEPARRCAAGTPGRCLAATRRRAAGTPPPPAPGGHQQ